MIHVRNDSILCQIFPSNLKGVAPDWFYSPLQRLFRNFEDLTKLFLDQYSSHSEFKKNNHHLISLKIRSSDSLKAHIRYFQNQLTRAHNCNEDTSALTFINGLKVSHPLYNHLVKYNVTCWSVILYRVQPYLVGRSDEKLRQPIFQP